MIKASHAESDTDIDASTNSRNLECWSRDPQAQALRVELNGGSWFIFPYSHFVFASLKHTGDEDELRISFTTHDVQVCGRGLMALLNAVQKMSIEWIRPLPKRYERLATADAVFVAKVDVAVSTVVDP
jgi:hypothetical protein